MRIEGVEKRRGLKGRQGWEERRRRSEDVFADNSIHAIDWDERAEYCWLRKRMDRYVTSEED